jgi:hypothetical protein
MTSLAAIDVADQVAGLTLALFTRLRGAAAAGGGSYAQVARTAGLIVAADDRADQSPAVFGDFWRQAARLVSPRPADYPGCPTN